MYNDPFYLSNSTTMTLEGMIRKMDSLEEFEERFPSDFLKNDAQVSNCLRNLLYKYDLKASVVSNEAELHMCKLRNLSDSFAEQNGRGAERADRLY